MVVAPASVATLPLGLEISDHRYVSAPRPASDEADPFNRTTSPLRTVWSRPPFATGATRSVDRLTVSATLMRVLSLTTSCAMYVPATSASNVGVIVDGSLSTAVLPSGTLVSAHE